MISVFFSIIFRYEIPVVVCRVVDGVMVVVEGTVGAEKGSNVVVWDGNVVTIDKGVVEVVVEVCNQPTQLKITTKTNIQLHTVVVLDALVLLVDVSFLKGFFRLCGPPGRLL